MILAGTDNDFRGEPFGPMPQLLAVAESVDKLHAICVICGNPASRNQRLIAGKPGALRLADDHGRQQPSRTRRGAAPATRCRAATRIRWRCSDRAAASGVS